jgi:hypothetical protein
MSQSTKYIAVVVVIAALLVVSYYRVLPNVVDRGAFQRWTAERSTTPRWTAERSTTISPLVSNENGLIELGDGWQRDVELSHAADQYDCLESAAKQLAAQLAEFVQDNQHHFEDTVFIRVHVDNEQLPTDLSTRLISSLEYSLPLSLGSLRDPMQTDPLNVRLWRADKQDQKDATESPNIELRVATLPAWSTTGGSPKSDCLVLAASIFFDHRVTTLQPLQIVAKDWIRQWSAYRNHPAHQHLQQYRAETIDQARMLVVRELANEWYKQRSNYRLLNALSRDQATKLIQQQLPRLDLHVDQFEQVFQLRMQDGSQVPALTRAALLVDLSPQKVDAVRSLLDSSSHRQRERFWSRLSLLGPLAAVLMIAALGLDRLTLGYYTWRIRGGALLLAGVIFVLLA